MSYNLLSFGKNIKELRKKLKLTQEGVSELSGVNVETIKRLERGKVIPKLETLESLSPVLKHDLNLLVLDYRIVDFSIYLEISENLESKFDSNEYQTLNIEIEKLQKLLPTIINAFYRGQIEQLILLTQGIILYKMENNPDLALETLIRALKIFTPSFSINRYYVSLYSPLEVRILMNIGFVYNLQADQRKYLSILEFCLDQIDDNNQLYPKICHNLAGAYRRRKEFEKALYYSNLGIDYCYKNRHLNGLYFLYYGKGVAEYHLGFDEHIDSFKEAVNLCEAFRETKLKESMIKNCYDYYSIKL